MTSRTKAATVAAVAVILALLAYSTVLAPAVAQTQSSSATSSTSSSTTSSTTTTTTSASASVTCVASGDHDSDPRDHGGDWQGGQGWSERCTPSVSVGQTITLTSTSGVYRVVGDRNENGTASGTLTFTVTGSLREGYTLSITSGSIVVNGTTYKISSGSAQMSTSANSISGQGTTTPTGAFIIQASAHGTFVGSGASVSVDFSAGSTEYLINLAASIQN